MDLCRILEKPLKFWLLAWFHPWIDWYIACSDHTLLRADYLWSSSLTRFSSIFGAQSPGEQLSVYRFGTGIGMGVLKLVIFTIANNHWSFHRLLVECKALLPEFLIPSPWSISYSNAIYMDNSKLVNYVKWGFTSALNAKTSGLPHPRFPRSTIEYWVSWLKCVSVRYLFFISLDFAPWIHEKKNTLCCNLLDPLAIMAKTQYLFALMRILEGKSTLWHKQPTYKHRGHLRHVMVYDRIR